MPYKFRFKLPLENTLSRWDLVRGTLQEYPERLGLSTDTNWRITSTAPGIYVSSDGRLSSNLTGGLGLGYFSAAVGQIAVSSDQRNVTVETTMRDYFPADFLTSPTPFVSSWRSFDGTPRNLWTAKYFSPLATAGFAHQNVTARSDTTGYLDQATLLANCLAIGQPGILEIETIYNQPDTANTMSPVGDDRFYAGNVQSDALNLLTHNDHPYFRGKWNPDDFDSSWIDEQREGPRYNETSGHLEHDFNLLYSVQKRNITSNSGYEVGDDNTYPGIKAEGSNGIKFSTKSPPGLLHPSPSNLSNWNLLLGICYRRTEASMVELRRKIKFYNLISNLTLQTLRDNSGGHSPNGMNLDIRDWDWCEAGFYPIPTDDFDLNQQFNSDTGMLANSMLANWSEIGTFSYSS